MLRLHVMQEIRQALKEGMTEDEARLLALAIFRDHGVTKHWHKPKLEFLLRLRRKKEQSPRQLKIYQISAPSAPKGLRSELYPYSTSILLLNY